MKPVIRSVLLALALVVPVSVMAGMFGNPAALWRPWHFDGRGFVPGVGASGAVVVMVRDGYLPFLQSGSDVRPEASLPHGHGAVAGYCYLQVVGGKLVYRSGTLPTVDCPVEIVGTAGTVLRQTSDINGFFRMPLPPGTYEIRGGGMPVRVSVTTGMTSLVAIRTGKRMGD